MLRTIVIVFLLLSIVALFVVVSVCIQNDIQASSDEKEMDDAEQLMQICKWREKHEV
jgi:uncharacterized membrane protein